MIKVSEHYDLLVENGNDPYLDSMELKAYMDKWDGAIFIEELNVNNEKSVLEIGCGTGRIAAKIANSVKNYVGIDISAKTIERAKQHFACNTNMQFLCGDFLVYRFRQSFDVIYSSLTFMHIKRKKSAIKKTFDLLNERGKCIISIDKNQSDYIDTGYSKIKIYPDNPQSIEHFLRDSGFVAVKRSETESAYILSAYKPQ